MNSTVWIVVKASISLTSSPAGSRFEFSPRYRQLSVWVDCQTTERPGRHFIINTGRSFREFDGVHPVGVHYINMRISSTTRYIGDFGAIRRIDWCSAATWPVRKLLQFSPVSGDHENVMARGSGDEVAKRTESNLASIWRPTRRPIFSSMMLLSKLPRYGFDTHWLMLIGHPS